MEKIWSHPLSCTAAHLIAVKKPGAAENYSLFHFGFLLLFSLLSWFTVGSSKKQLKCSWNTTMLMGLLSRNQGANTIWFFYYCNRNSPAKLELAVIFYQLSFTHSIIFEEQDDQTPVKSYTSWERFGSWVLPQYSWSILFYSCYTIITTTSTLSHHHSYSRNVLPKSEQPKLKNNLQKPVTYVNTSSWNVNVRSINQYI